LEEIRDFILARVGVEITPEGRKEPNSRKCKTARQTCLTKAGKPGKIVDKAHKSEPK